MKTIDRIMYNLRNFYVPADEKYIREIIEAELIAVKWVDDLEAKLNQAQNNAEIWTAIWAIYDYLKQTPVVSEK